MRLAATLFVVGLTMACHDNVLNPSDRATSSLTISEADPANGNGTLDPDATVIQYFTDQGVEDLDKVTVSAVDSAGAVGHELEIYWHPGTGKVRFLQHFWAPLAGATSGATRCAAGTANVCDPATVLIDTTGGMILFKSTILLDMFQGDATSTLTGFVFWPLDDPIGSDH